MQPGSILSISTYVPENLDTVIEIFQQAIRQIANKDYDEQQIAAWSTVDRGRWSERRLNRPTWIAWIDGKAAGFSDLEENGHLDMMFVHPDFQNRGVATALLSKVEEAAAERNLTRIFTEASITARPFFEKKGFREIAGQLVEIRGAKLKNYRMEKFL